MWWCLLAVRNVSNTQMFAMTGHTRVPPIRGVEVRAMVLNLTLQQYFRYIVAVSFIAGGNRTTL